jgi:hypothetical protein
MSKRKNPNQREKWKELCTNISKKRTGKKSGLGNSAPEVLTVQRLSAEVEGKCQKYSRIGALTMVPFGEELSMENVKKACSKHFNVSKHMECDVLAGERGPSYTDINQISNLKLLHVRFVEKSYSVEVDDREVKPEVVVPSSSSTSFPKNWW